jgi:hypothetical protein
MQDPFTTEKIIEIINGAADKSLEKTQSYRAVSPEDTASFSEADIEKLLNETSDEIVRKEQVDYLSEQIKKRFLKIKSVSKENFNMFEVAMQCQKLVTDYKQLAKEKGWREIEQMFSKRDNY